MKFKESRRMRSHSDEASTLSRLPKIDYSLSLLRKNRILHLRLVYSVRCLRTE